MNTNHAGNFSERLANFVDHLQAVRNDEFAKNFPNLVAPRVDVIEGRRYVKIVAQDRTRDRVNGDVSNMESRSVICFVDKVNGDILKAATWKAPVTKSARGSIFASVLPGNAFGGFYVDSVNVVVTPREEAPRTLLNAGPANVADLDAVFG